MTLRPYQQRAHDKVMAWVLKSTMPCLVEAVTAAGKSHIIAALAKTIFVKTGKRVLCLAPSAELVEQNHEKYLATGERASIFSASLGIKSLKHPVVFGTPGTVKNRISRFLDQFAMVILDEAHGITPTIKSIIDAMREGNPNLRVVGFTATPYRMLTGYIFAQFPDGKPVPDWQTVEPYFEACVDRITARELLSLGFLTPAMIGSIGAEAYATDKLRLNSRGQFETEDVDAAFVGYGRKTASIVADIVAQSASRRGVMIFAATVQHANEIMASLPPRLSAIITAETSRADRREILRAFKAFEIKYLVNVSVLTTGFDAPHVDVIAIMRATESVGLLQQIVGRGLRIAEGKADCLILDYAENIDRHCPDGDIFQPEIKAAKVGGDGKIIKCLCPDCHAENEFKARKNEEGYGIDENGYYLDLDGRRVPSEFGDIPAHFGRRCQGRTARAYEVERCAYRWTFKPCPHCNAENDIAARYCAECRGEIVDPNDKLRIAFKELKRDPTKRQTDEVLAFDRRLTISRSGNETERIDVVTPYRSFSYWVMKNPRHSIGMRERQILDELNGVQPSTITYQKDADSGFFRVTRYNGAKDEDPTQH